MKAIKTLVTSILLVAGFATTQAQDSKAVDIYNSSVVKQKPYCSHYENIHIAKETNFEACVEGEPILAAEGKRVFENFPKMMPAKDAQGREIAVQGMYPLEFSMNAVK